MLNGVAQLPCKWNQQDLHWIIDRIEFCGRWTHCRCPTFPRWELVADQIVASSYQVIAQAANQAHHHWGGHLPLLPRHRALQLLVQEPVEFINDHEWLRMRGRIAENKKEPVPEDSNTSLIALCTETDEMVYSVRDGMNHLQQNREQRSIYLAHKKLLLILKLCYTLLQICNISAYAFDIVFSCSFKQILHFPEVH